VELISSYTHAEKQSMRLALSVLLILTLVAPASPQEGGRPSVTDAQAGDTGPRSKVAEVKVPKGTPVEIETAYEVSSATAEEGDAISFRVVSPVKVDGVTVIAAGALATGLIVKAKKRGHWGRAGQLGWSMRDTVAVDDQRVPLQFGRVTEGEGKGGEVATKTVVTGVLLWPIAPVALLWGFKKGKHAVVPLGKRVEAFTSADVVVRVVEAH
jgi:hypothetical protein